MAIKTYTVNVSHYFEYDSFNSDRRSATNYRV